MNYEAYLITEGRGKEISYDEAKKLLKQNCTQALKGYTKGNLLYRGVVASYGDFAQASPTGIRKSRNTENYYTLLVDNSPHWKKYPKRSKSFICSSEWTGASAFGTVYSMWPYNGTKVGVCPAPDFWLSFRRPGTLSGFNSVLKELMQKAGIPFQDDSYSQMVKSMQEFDRKVRDREVNLEWILNNISMRPEWLDNEYKKNKYRLYDTIEEMFKPEANRFKLVSVGQEYGSGTGMAKECWFSGPCVMVRKGLEYKSSVSGMTKGNPTSVILKDLGYSL